MGAAKRRGNLEQRIAQSRARSTAELEARQAANAKLQKARRAQTPQEAEQFILRGQRHRRTAALVAAMVAMTMDGGRR